MLDDGVRDHVEIHIAEALVVRPGDTLIIRLNTDGVTTKKLAELQARLHILYPDVRGVVFAADGEMAVQRADPQMAARLDRLDNLVSRLLTASADGFADIAKSLLAAAREVAFDPPKPYPFERAPLPDAVAFDKPKQDSLRERLARNAQQPINLGGSPPATP